MDSNQGRPGTKGPRDTGAPEMREIIENLIGEFDARPREINAGQCWDFADAMLLAVGGRGVLFSDAAESHIFFRAGRRYYDAEAPYGCRDWRAMPYFIRRPCKGIKNWRSTARGIAWPEPEKGRKEP